MAVRDKTFKIDLVNNYVHELYTEIVSLSFDLKDLSDDTPDVKTRKELKELRNEYKRVAKEIVTIREGIVKELMESNGYEFDPVWWKRKTSADDLNDFIFNCIKKDESAIDEKKTKKK